MSRLCFLAFCVLGVLKERKLVMLWCVCDGGGGGREGGGRVCAHVRVYALMHSPFQLEPVGQFSRN
jgi:hypothetical protein